MIQIPCSEKQTYSVYCKPSAQADSFLSSYIPAQETKKGRVAQTLYELMVLQLMAAAQTFSAAFSSNLFSFQSFCSILTQVNLTYAQVTASLFIDFVFAVKIRLPVL